MNDSFKRMSKLLSWSVRYNCCSASMWILCKWTCTGNKATYVATWPEAGTDSNEETELKAHSHDRKKKPSSRESLEFCSLKCKLTTVVKNKEVHVRLRQDVILTHEAFKQSSFFLSIFCLEKKHVPEMNNSTMKQCLNQVCAQDARGAKLKDTDLSKEMTVFWDQKFSSFLLTKCWVAFWLIHKNPLQVQVWEDGATPLTVTCGTGGC